MVIQSSYSINPPVGFPGTIAEPNSPTRVERGVLHIASGDNRATGGARPGDAVVLGRHQQCLAGGARRRFGTFGGGYPILSR